MRFTILAIVGTAIAAPVILHRSAAKPCHGPSCFALWKRREFIAPSSLDLTDGNEPLKRDTETAEDDPKTLILWKKDAEKREYTLPRKDDEVDNPKKLILGKKDVKAEAEATPPHVTLWRKDADAEAEPTVQGAWKREADAEAEPTVKEFSMWKRDADAEAEAEGAWKREAEKQRPELWKKEADADAEPVLA